MSVENKPISAARSRWWIWLALGTAVAALTGTVIYWPAARKPPNANVEQLSSFPEVPDGPAWFADRTGASDVDFTYKNGEESDLFSGEFWTGQRAVALGLADGLGELRTVVKERFGERVRIKVIAPERGGWRRRLLGAERGDMAAWPAAMLAAIEERALWSRFGL